MGWLALLILAMGQCEGLNTGIGAEELTPTSFFISILIILLTLNLGVRKHIQIEMSIIAPIYRKFHTLILYGIIGCFTSTLDFAVFTILSSYAGLYYLLANCISVLVGITTSFFLNRTYNFKVKDKTIRRFLVFLSVGLCGLMLSNVILWIGIDVMGESSSIVKLLSIVLVVFFQFLLNKYVTFRVKSQNP